MTCHIGEGIIVCGGISGGWRVAPSVQCPWCRELRRCLRAAIFGGWEGYDYICGTCGSKWGNEWAPRKLTEEQRDKNIARVAAQQDPKCWECHDTGDKSDPGNPLAEGPEPCGCGGAQ